MDERKVGVIPHLVVQGVGGPKEYGVLLTDRQLIFVLEKKSNMAAGWAIGGVIGAAIAGAVSSRREVDYYNTPPDMLANDPKNIAIPHEALNALRLKKSLGSYGLRIEYTNAEGKRKKIQAFVQPPQSLLKERKAQGVKAKVVVQEYANNVRQAFQAAMPPETARRAEWRM